MTAAKCPTAIRTHVSRDYEIGDILATQKLIGGMFLEPCRLSTTLGSYVLRAHQFRQTDETFKFQAETLQLLHDAGHRCPRVIKRRDGSWGESDGNAFWALHEYAAGHIYSWDEWWELKADRQFLFDCGAAIAKLHDDLAAISPSGDPSLLPSLPPIQFSHLHDIQVQWESDLDRFGQPGPSAHPHSQRALMADRRELKDYWEILGSAVSEGRICDLPSQIVHGDISPVNAVFSGGDFTLIDWDCSRYGFRLYDALGDLLIRRPDGATNYAAFDPAEVLAYLDGYQHATKRPISVAELHAVPVFCLARQLEDLRQRVAVLSQIDAASDFTYALQIGSRIQSMREISRLFGLCR